MKKKTNAHDLLYGIHSVAAAITAGRRDIFCVYVADAQKNKERQQQIITLARQSEVPVEIASEADMTSMTGTEAHQGIAARTGPYPFFSLEKILASSSKQNQPPSLLIIDGVTDTHNLGALVRTAICAGLTGIVIPKNNAASPTPVASKISAGALEFARIARETNIARTVDFLKENGVWIAGLASDTKQSIYETDLSGAIALVVGDEHKGIRRLVKEKCDFLMAIPQSRKIDSLNVSVAGGIAMYELYRQRSATKTN